MATWRCPHCRTVQADSARCFLCGRSATSCGTCVNFRQSVIGDVGFCGLDRRRAPLSGEEQRGCWSGGAAGLADDILAGFAELAGATGAASPAGSRRLRVVR